MTDKEQIIINGIDYTNALEDYLNDCIVDYCKSAHCDIEMAKDIILFPVAKQIEKLQQEKEKFKHECEELKEKLKREIKNTVDMERLARSYGQDMLTYRQEKQIEIEELQTNIDRYRKALEEIEKIVSKNYYDDTWADISIKLDDILNIINNAKGEGKCQ